MGFKKHKVLILSSHFLPSNVVAAFRPKGYLDYFPVDQFDVTLVTFYQEFDKRGNYVVYPNTQKQVVLVTYNDRRVFQVVRKESRLKKFYDLFEGTKLTRGIKILFRWMIGSFPDINHSVDGYGAFKKFLWGHLEEETYDVMISLFMPPYHIKLSHEVYRKFGLKYIIDFRDLWDNRLAMKYPVIPAWEGLRNKIQTFYFKRWMSKALFFTITSKEWGQIVREKVGKDFYIITNGFEKIKSPGTIDRFSTFTIGYSGRMTEFQSSDLLIDGVKQWISVHPRRSLDILLLGTSEYQPASQNLVKSLDGIVQVTFLPKVEKSEAMEFVRKCHVLWYPGFDQIRGWCAAKVYDFLASGTPILVAPGDNGLVDDIVRETQTGQVAGDSQEVYDFIEEHYRHFEHKTFSEVGIRSKIDKYSREYQSLKYAELISRSLRCEDI